MIKKKNIIYLTRDGLLEPLGQSQILSYLIPLSKFYNITIISFEKQNDLKLDGHLKFIKDICIKYSIDWHYFNYYQFSRTFGILLGFLKLFILTTYLCKQKKIDFIHSRSYYPAFVSLIIHKILNIPFIFDMRALWPEELVESKRISKNGYAWKIIKRLEKSCLKNSASVVSLTNAAVQHLHLTFPDFNLKSKTIVIPTCANLNKFKIKIDKKLTYQNKIKLSCIGSVLSGWFKLDFLRDQT